MTRVLVMAGGAVLAAGLWPSPVVLDQTPAPIFVGVRIATTTNLPVYEVPCTKFEVLADARPRPIVHCAPGAAVTLALLIDVSGSFDYQISIGSIVRELASTLRPDDRLGIGWFAREVVAPAAFTRDRRTLDAAAEQAARAAKDAAGPSPLWDALTATVTALGREPGRRAAIVLTDGRATGNSAPFPLAAREIMMSGVEIHAIGTPLEAGARQRGGAPDPRARLSDLALASGGTASAIGRTATEVKDLARLILEDVQRSYLIGFTPDSRDEQMHGLKVSVHLPGLIVRAPTRFGAR